MGTPHYMSPEQCLGEELDNRADIYSIGVVVYEMLCGRVPFNSPISTAVVVQHVNQPPPPLRTINPSVSTKMEAAVLHALEKRREARPQTANAFAREVMDAAGVAIVRHEDQWNNRIAQTAVEPSVDDERTVEQRQAIAAQKISQEMAPTVHLASLSGSTSVIPGHSTAGSGAMPTATVRQNVTRNYAIVALGTLLCVSVVLAIVWRLSQSGTANNNSSVTPQVSKEDTAVNTPNASSATKTHGNPTPPVGMLYVNG